MGTQTNNKINSCKLITSLAPTYNDFSVVADSGCTSHIIQSATPCSNKVQTPYGLCVGTPNGNVKQASHSAKLDLDHLNIKFSNTAQLASVHPDLSSKSLLSLGQLCRNGCDYILLDKNYVSTIIYGNITIIRQRDHTNGLW